MERGIGRASRCSRDCSRQRSRRFRPSNRRCSHGYNCGGLSTRMAIRTLFRVLSCSLSNLFMFLESRVTRVHQGNSVIFRCRCDMRRSSRGSGCSDGGLPYSKGSRFGVERRQNGNFQCFLLHRPSTISGFIRNSDRMVSGHVILTV